MVDLDSKIWSTLKHAGGFATGYPAIIRSLSALIETDGVPDDELSERMWDICHQQTTYTASVAAIPHLIAICEETNPEQPIRKSLLDLIAYTVACIRTNRTDAAPEIVAAFDHSLSSFTELVQRTVLFADGRTELCRLLGALSIAQGDDDLGVMMYEMPRGTIQCRKCNEFISIFESSLNPLRG